jgi:hypothetical protein
VDGFLVSTKWVELDRGSNRTFMIQGAESGGVPGVHQVGGQVARGDTGHGYLDTGKHITPCFLPLDSLAC